MKRCDECVCNDCIHYDICAVCSYCDGSLPFTWEHCNDRLTVEEAAEHFLKLKEPDKEMIGHENLSVENLRHMRQGICPR